VQRQFSIATGRLDGASFDLDSDLVNMTEARSAIEAAIVAVMADRGVPRSSGHQRTAARRGRLRNDSSGRRTPRLLACLQAPAAGGWPPLSIECVSQAVRAAKTRTRASGT